MYYLAVWTGPNACHYLCPTTEEYLPSSIIPCDNYNYPGLSRQQVLTETWQQATAVIASFFFRVLWCYNCILARCPYLLEWLSFPSTQQYSRWYLICMQSAHRWKSSTKKWWDNSSQTWHVCLFCWWMIAFMSEPHQITLTNSQCYFIYTSKFKALLKHLFSVISEHGASEVCCTKLR